MHKMNYKQFTKQQDINFSKMFLFNKEGEKETTEEAPAEEKDVGTENKDTQESSPPTTEEVVSHNNSEGDNQTTESSNPSNAPSNTWGLGSISSIFRKAWDNRGKSPTRKMGPRPAPHYITMEGIANWIANVPPKGSSRDMNPRNHAQESNPETQQSPEQNIQTQQPVTQVENQTSTTDNSNVDPKNNKRIPTSDPVSAHKVPQEELEEPKLGIPVGAPTEGKYDPDWPEVSPYAFHQIPRNHVGQPNEVPNAHRVPVGYNSDVRSGIDTKHKDPYYAHPKDPSTRQAPREIPDWFYPTKEQVAQARIYDSPQYVIYGGAGQGSIKISNPEQVKKYDPLKAIPNLRGRDYSTISDLEKQGYSVVTYGGDYYYLEKDGTTLQRLDFSNPNYSQYDGRLGVKNVNGNYVAFENKSKGKEVEGLDLAAINSGKPFVDDEGYQRRFDSSTGRFVYANQVIPGQQASAPTPTTTGSIPPTLKEKQSTEQKGKEGNKVVTPTKMTPEQVKNDPNIPDFLKNAAYENDVRKNYLKDPSVQKDVFDAFQNRNKDEESKQKWDTYVSLMTNVSPKNKDEFEQKKKYIEDNMVVRSAEIEGLQKTALYFKDQYEQSRQRIINDSRLSEDQKKAAIQKLENDIGKTEVDAIDFAQNTAKNLTKAMLPGKDEDLSTWWGRLDDSQKTGLIAGGGLGLLTFLMMMGKDEKDATDWILGLGLPVLFVGAGSYLGSASKADPTKFDPNRYKAYKKQHGVQ